MGLSAELNRIKLVPECKRSNLRESKTGLHTEQGGGGERGAHWVPPHKSIIV